MLLFTFKRAKIAHFSQRPVSECANQVGNLKWDALGLSLPSLDIDDGLGDTVESAEQVLPFGSFFLI